MLIGLYESASKHIHKQLEKIPKDDLEAIIPKKINHCYAGLKADLSNIYCKGISMYGDIRITNEHTKETTEIKEAPIYSLGIKCRSPDIDFISDAAKLNGVKLDNSTLLDLIRPFTAELNIAHSKIYDYERE